MKYPGDALFPYYDPKLNRDLQGDAKSLESLMGTLESDRLEALIEADQLTLALLRPGLGPEANLEGLEDNTAASTIEKHIQNLGIAVKFSLDLDNSAVEGFYGGTPKEVMLNMPPYLHTHFACKWDEFQFMMTTGKSTILLLYGNNAVKTWRSQLGSWNVDDERSPGFIRGDLATNNYNDLVHGSDSIDSVINEIQVIRDCIARQSSET